MNNPVSLKDLLSKEHIARLLAGDDPEDSARRELALAHEAASERFDRHHRLIVEARVPIPDADAIATALLPDHEHALDEPPLSDDAMRLRAALAAIHARKLPGVAPFVETSALRAVRTALRDRARNHPKRKPYVAILGTTGTGKTVAAAHGIARLPGSVYIRARTLCDLFGSFHRDDRHELRRLYAAPLAVIDEVQLELADKGIGRAMDEVVDERQGARRITVFAGNVKPMDLAKMLDARSVSRMRGRTDWVQIVEKDLRTERMS